MPDGSLIEATPVRNADVFNGVIGGYGGLGVIVEATLALTDNVKVKRQDRTIAVDDYPHYFFDYVRHAPGAVLHNGDIYPPGYDTVHAITYTETEEAPTVPDRLIPSHASYRLDRFTYWVVSEWPFGKAIRRRVIDPALFRGTSVTSRNYQSSYDAAELEPASRASSTYALQEYFVPVDRFSDFVSRMRNVLARHHVNVINISIRHVLQDSQSLLAWARGDVFGFVIYYKQGTSAAAQTEVGVWARELIDAALSVDGTYYLPYQLHATEAQFRRAYPRAAEFFALKRQLDSAGKLRNRLWDTYSGGNQGPSAAAHVR
jgi:FAD/FMN-containing dehydrogenase